MNAPVKHSLNLNKTSRSSGSSYKKANSFADKMMRVLYIFLLVAIDLVMFIYSINGKLLENGVLNPALLYIFAGIFAVSFVLIFLFFFSKDMQNIMCALVTLIVVVVFYNQFAQFDVNTFVEKWLDKNASWLSVFAIIPSCWLVGLLFAIAIFFAFRYSISLFFITIVLLASSILGIKNSEFTEVDKKEYYTVKDMSHNAKGKLNKNIIYFMVPEFPSYHFLSNVKNSDFRELRDLMIGFYANNEFEIFPNAFVEKDDAISNIIDIYNQVDYTSTTSANRGYAEIIHDWNFRHGTLDAYALEFNELYDALKKDGGYNISTYSAPEFNLCYKKDDLYSDRCVVKNYKTVSLYDKNATVEKNVYAILGEWILSIKMRELNPVARMFISMSNLRNMKVLSENRRVSIEGATKLFKIVASDFVKDKDGGVYMVYVDLPSDIYIYDEYCNLKPRKEWVSIKDNSLYKGGIENKRKAYVEQTKCLLGQLQGFMNEARTSDKLAHTDIIIQGVSNINELSELQAGRYSNFVKDRLVNLAIRKGIRPKFLINANICLASDFTKSMLRYQDYCYTIDNMKMPSDEMYSLKQNLINNSVIRGNKISNIAINYREWYADFESKNEDILRRKRLLNVEKEEVKLSVETMPVAPEAVLLDDSSAVYYDLNAFNPDNIFAPSDELIQEEIPEKVEEGNTETSVEKTEEVKSEVSVENKEEVVSEKAIENVEEKNNVDEDIKELSATDEIVEEKKAEVVLETGDEPASAEFVVKNTEENEDFEPAEFSEDSQIDF